MLPITPGRVPTHTTETVNRRIHRDRLHELDEEWGIEEMLEANAATVAPTGTVIGICVRKGFLIVPLAITDFLPQHATQGWCPRVPFFRKRRAQRLEVRHQKSGSHMSSGSRTFVSESYQ